VRSSLRRRGSSAFADESANVWVPHLVVGIVVLGFGLMTEIHPRDEARMAQLGRRDPSSAERRCAA
jgi:hypothetical protein